MITKMKNSTYSCLLHLLSEKDSVMSVSKNEWALDKNIDPEQKWKVSTVVAVNSKDEIFYIISDRKGGALFCNHLHGDFRKLVSHLKNEPANLCVECSETNKYKPSIPLRISENTGRGEKKPDILKWSNEYIDSKVTSKESVQPVFFVVYGPQASGKSSVMKRIKNPQTNLNVFDNNDALIREFNSVDVNVDEIVTTNPGYLSDLEEIQKVQEPTQGELGDLYGKWRVDANSISDTLTYRAVTEKLNVFWETTGFSVDWTIGFTSKIRRISAYKIYVVYPFVTLKTLKARAKNRKQAYDEKQIEQTFKNSQKNLCNLLPYIDSLFILDNERVGLEAPLEYIFKLTHVYQPEIYTKKYEEGQMITSVSKGDYFFMEKGPSYSYWQKWNDIDFIELFDSMIKNEKYTVCGK